MAQPICLKCLVDMNVVKNGVAVFAKNPSLVCDIIMVKFGDRYICPECSAQIITGFGQPMYYGEYTEEHLKAMLVGRETYELAK